MRRALPLGILVATVAAAPAGATTVQFTATGAEQSFTVPSGVSSVHIALHGGTGGTGHSTSTGGLGGASHGDLQVTPGEVLYVEVGGTGGDGPANGAGAGGYNGGGQGASATNGGGGGGGASDVRTTPAAMSGTLASRLIVAGGGGGGGGAVGGALGGAGGGTAGADGGNVAACGGGPPPGGAGGTQSGGGAHGSNGGTDGALGVGGSGSDTSVGGGGGGGGYYGGGGAGGCQGGGGGSGYLGPALTAGAFDAASAGPATVTFTYTQAPPPVPTPTALVPAGPANDNAPKVKGTADPGATVDVFTNATCQGAPAATGGADVFGTTGIAVPVPDNAATTISVRAENPAGTSACSPITLTYVEDSTAPSVTIDSGPSGVTSDTTPTFAFHASETASFACSLDTGSAAFAACSGPGATHAPAAPLAPGGYIFRVRATDAAGNTGAESDRSFTVAGSPSPSPSPTPTPTPSSPETNITSHPRARIVTRAKTVKVRFRFASTSAVATFRCKLDAGRDSACDSGVTYKVRPGFHSFRVAAVLDGVTDPTPATFSFTVRRKATRH